LFYLAVKSKSTKTITLFLNNRFKLFARDREKKSVLYITVERRDKQIINLLIIKGIEINLINKQGYTPLRHAARRKHEKITKLLLNGGANIIIKEIIKRPATN